MPQPRSRPADACPHPRPFPAGFDACVAYQPAPFIGLDTHGRRLPMVWTCHNLGVGGEKTDGGHYPRCVLGDAEARARWVARLDADRVRRMRELRRRFSEFARPHLAGLWEAKSKAKDRAGAQPLHEAANRYLMLADAFLQENAAELEAVGLPPTDASALIRAAVEHWLQSTAAPNSFRMPDQILEQFPPAGRLLIQPETA